MYTLKSLYFYLSKKLGEKSMDNYNNLIEAEHLVTKSFKCDDLNYLPSQRTMNN